jgi:hypothetical protein
VTRAPLERKRLARQPQREMLGPVICVKAELENYGTTFARQAPDVESYGGGDAVGTVTNPRAIARFRVSGRRRFELEPIRNGVNGETCGS